MQLGVVPVLTVSQRPAKSACVSEGFWDTQNLGNGPIPVTKSSLFNVIINVERNEDTRAVFGVTQTFPFYRHANLFTEKALCLDAVIPLCLRLKTELYK